jgi:2-methylaconitate cis-trans-isomerase PrpF
MILIDLDADLAHGRSDIRRAALIRTARRIFEGRVFVPANVWPKTEHAQTHAPALA